MALSYHIPTTALEQQYWNCYQCHNYWKQFKTVFAVLSGCRVYPKYCILKSLGIVLFFAVYPPSGYTFRFRLIGFTSFSILGITLQIYYFTLYNYQWFKGKIFTSRKSKLLPWYPNDWVYPKELHIRKFFPFWEHMVIIDECKDPVDYFSLWTQLPWLVSNCFTWERFVFYHQTCQMPDSFKEEEWGLILYSQKTNH